MEALADPEVDPRQQVPRRPQSRHPVLVTRTVRINPHVPRLIFLFFKLCANVRLAYGCLPGDGCVRLARLFNQRGDRAERVYEKHLHRRLKSFCERPLVDKTSQAVDMMLKRSDVRSRINEFAQPHNAPRVLKANDRTFPLFPCRDLLCFLGKSELIKAVD